MNKKLISSLLILVILINISACSTAKKIRYEAEFLELFDTITKIVGYTDNKEEFSSYTQLIYDDLKEYHELYDIYHTYEGVNNIKTINDNAGIKPIKVDQKIIDLLLFSKEKYLMTDGKVNIAFGAVLKVWHDYRTEGIDNPENAKLPPMELLKEKVEHTDINKVIIDEVESTVYLMDSEMSLDVGAIAKGYATERVSNTLIGKGFTNWMISVGGNVRTIGTKGDGKLEWNVGIQNPDLEASDDYLAILSLSDMSLVTSGNYERYYTVGDKQYHHIIDSETLMPSEYFTAVTIICRDSGVADALSTAVYNMSFEEGLALIEELPDTEALWVYKNGELKYSSHFQEYITK